MPVHPTNSFPCTLCKAREHSVFAHTEKKTIQKLGEEKTLNRFTKNEMLFKEGNHPQGVFCIKKGKIKVFRLGFDGKEQIIQIAKEGDLLGYRALISNEVYPVSAQALEQVEACFVGKAEFMDLISSSRELNYTLLKQACKELGRFTEAVTNQAQMSVRERCAISLYQLYEIYGGTGENHVEINLTREDLANIVGTATETLIRLLHDFKEDNILQSKGRKIKIIDPERLKRIGHLLS